MIKTDLAIIGSGPGGYAAAVRAVKRGLDTTVIEKADLGGECLNWGCVPTKSLYRAARLVNDISKGSKIGISANYRVDYAATAEWKDSIVSALRKSIGNNFKKNNIRLLKGNARLKSKLNIETENEQVKAKNIIIAAGSSPVSIDKFDLKTEGIMSSREILSLTEVPKSLLIIGGGVIGIEFANIFSSLGCSVTIVEALPRILAAEDVEISNIISSSYKKRDIRIQTSATVADVWRTKSGFIAETSEGRKIEAEKILVSVGRKPNTENLGLKDAGVKTSSQGYIAADRHLSTTADNIYAVGDVIGGYLLTHVASSEGKTAVQNIIGDETEMDYSSVPYAVFSSPEIGSVGLSEEEAIQEGFNIKVGRLPFTSNSKAFIDGESDGLVKIITDASTGEILGARIIGAHASELIHEISLAKSAELLIEDVASALYTHPTLSEALLEASESLFGTATHV